jgi:hypothetical protein
MSHSRIRTSIVLSLLLTAATLSGCGKSEPSGTYHGGNITMDFKGGKVTLNMLGDAKTLDYKVDGDTITIINPVEGNVVLTRNSDGSLNSPMGTFTKN